MKINRLIWDEQSQKEKSLNVRIYVGQPLKSKIDTIICNGVKEHQKEKVEYVTISKIHVN